MIYKTDPRQCEGSDFLIVDPAMDLSKCAHGALIALAFMSKI